jgi:hypothetical protein
MKQVAADCLKWCLGPQDGDWRRQPQHQEYASSPKMVLKSMLIPFQTGQFEWQKIQQRGVKLSARETREQPPWSWSHPQQFRELLGQGTWKQLQQSFEQLRASQQLGTA